jgi:hypothetical protein
MLKTILTSFFFSLSALYNAQDWVQVGTGITGNVICMEELNGKIYVGGNFTGDLNYMAEYDPSTQLWTDIGNEFITYAVMGMTTYNGKLYVSGLYQWASGDIVAEYDPATGVWSGLGTANSLSAISELEV